VVALAAGWWVYSQRSTANRHQDDSQRNEVHVTRPNTAPQPASPREREKLRHATPQEQ
jgi:hypothetical protein